GECDVFVPWVDEVREHPDPEMPWIASERPMPSWTPMHPHLGYWVRELVGSLRARGARRVGFELVYGDLLEGLRSELAGAGPVPACSTSTSSGSRWTACSVPASSSSATRSATSGAGAARGSRPATSC